MSGPTRTPDGSRAFTGITAGDVIADKYRIDAVLGVGGMGVVFLARHLELDAPVALKFLSAEYVANAEAIRRFRLEAQAAVKLRNEHVVRVFDVGMHTSGLPYMVMEYLEGVDLEKLIRSSGPLAPELAADLLVQTCEALTDAHGKGIIHRDLKPSNLFCMPRADGRLTIKVVDFGISKVTGALSVTDQGLTGTGNVVGSPSYMSPEQMKTPNRIDHRTDIWSLGVVLYECLTGALPFPASTYAEICLRVHQDPPVPASENGPEIPTELEAVMLRCLQKDVEQRYGSAAELALALAPFAPISARGTPAPFTRVTRALVDSSADRAPSEPAARFDTQTFAQPNWTRTKHSLRVRMGGPRIALLMALIVTLVGAAVWLLATKPASPAHVLVGAATVTQPAPDSLVATPQEVPAAPATAPASSPAPISTAVPAVSAAPPTSESPLAARRAVEPTTGPRTARPAAAPRATASSSPHLARPRTERDPRSSTWTR